MSEPPASILVVEDESYIRTLLHRWLTEQGYQCTTAADGVAGWGQIQKEVFDLVVSDINMPGMTGLELLALIRSHFPEMGVIMVTAVDDRETAIRALELGAFGYIIKPFEQTEVLIHVAGALERRRLLLAGNRQRERLEEAVAERTRDLRRREEEICLRLVWAAERRDQDTGDHIRRIGLYSARLAEKRGWTAPMVEDIRVAATMHDIGKIGIPDEVLLKRGKLTAEEYQLMKRHTEIGAGILEDSEIPLLQMAREIALYHHERWDGSGYPRGLAGEDIPESARIVAVVDVYDSLISERIYKDALPEDQVLTMMKEKRNTHFDPEILDAFLELVPAFREIRRQLEGEISAPD